MQEHFNENYLESDKFPKSVFKGQIDHHDYINFEKDGLYAETVTGQLTIHGITQTVSIPVTITIQNGVTMAKAEFNIVLSDYSISIPSL